MTAALTDPRVWQAFLLLGAYIFLSLGLAGLWVTLCIAVRRRTDSGREGSSGEARVLPYRPREW